MVNKLFPYVLALTIFGSLSSLKIPYGGMNERPGFTFLKNKWLNDKSDTARINAGLKLYANYYKENDDSVVARGNLLLGIYHLSIKSNYSQGIIESSFHLGNNFNFQFKTPEAITYYYISLKESETGKNLKAVARPKWA